MDQMKCKISGSGSSLSKAPLNFANMVAQEKAHFEQQSCLTGHTAETDVDIDLREVYFLILHFLSAGPCQRTFEQLCNELSEHQLLPRRYHAWFSRSGLHSGSDGDAGVSFPLSYTKLVERYTHIENDHLVKLMKQLLLHTASPLHGKVEGNAPNAADVPTLLGSGSFSLLECERSREYQPVKHVPAYLHWPHIHVDQVRGLTLREIGGGFAKHHRAPSIRSACYAVAKPSTMVQKMQNTKKLRGHRNAVYCAIYDRSGRYVITGSDDRLVKIWSMETAFCLASCRGHEGDITDLAVSSNNALVASAANDFVIRVWRLPDGMPISVLRGHTGAVTAIAFSPRPSSIYQLLSSSDDGTCRIWDARSSNTSPRVYLPKPPDTGTGKSSVPPANGSTSSNGPQSHQILCCAYNANGTVFVTGSSDTHARVWSACKINPDDSDQPIHELDLLIGHENDVNYVQFSGCAVASRFSISDASKEENIPRFKTSWFGHENIVTCSRDGSAIIWVPRTRKSHGKNGRWTRAYHLKVPPPPLPPQPARGGPRQRFLPTPRGVNMIIWSLDNRFVLAAIMDCRICVWNAVDGSLVHSLTGHTESSYVLDVHPFNPRIAMSAGYDGRTIIWDIWEGTPIKTYEIGRFKLVDGKFSPDGTSIVLSDDVGQIYFLNTGQGESQKDAKYDQFFLGDYRPLIRDPHGHVLDQETQLPPYRRNIQDLLCDSSMIPYPEPYQTMYQQRRLGALGLEWCPSTIRFAVGPDISLGQDYEMPPLEDLERMIEPLPEFIDAMYWEPENEVISNDTDSEYNATEESSSEGELGSLLSNSCSDPECSAEDSEVDKDGLRRSRRRKHNNEVELMTSSGRRVRKRNLDGRDGSTLGSKRAKKSRSGRKASKRKLSKAKSSRPQRVAARNARTMLSKITGTSTDGDDDDDSEDDSSNSQSELQDSDIESNEANGNLNNLQERYTKEQALLFEPDAEAKTSKLPEPQSNIGSRKKLVLKLSLRDIKRPVPLEDCRPNSANRADLLNLSSEAREMTEESRICANPGVSSVDDVNVKLSENYNKINFLNKRAKDHLDEPEGDKENNIRWGEVKIRTSKYSRSGDLMSTDASIKFNVGCDFFEDNMSNANRDEEQLGIDALQDSRSMKSKELMPEELHKGFSSGSSSLGDQHLKHNASVPSGDGNIVKDEKDWLEPDHCENHVSAEINEVIGTNCSDELKENPPPKPTKFIIKTKKVLSNPGTSSKHKFISAGDDQTHVGDGAKLEFNEGFGGSSSVQLRHSTSKPKLCNDVYEKVKLYGGKTDFGDFDGVVEEDTSVPLNNHYSEFDFPEAATDAVRRTRSLKMKATSRVPNARNCDVKVRMGHESVSASKNMENLRSKGERLPEKWILSSKQSVRSRSVRSRRGGYYDNHPSFSGGRKSNHDMRKLSWLMLSEHEEGNRYVPQLGDEVVYLRQGHEEYIETSGVREGPSISNKRHIRAVEICKIERLDYRTCPGSGDSCCKLTLLFTDPSSSVCGQTFVLTLPELVNFPDFIIEKTRYDAAFSRNWSNRDKCHVWWRNENGEGGNWWEGRIVSVQPKSNDFPDSPWERYHIRYKTDPSGSPHQHSPWELHDLEMMWEQPHIDDEIKEKLLSTFIELEQSVGRNKDYYGIQKLNETSQKLDFFNRYPVALYPGLIRSRLEKNYYRNLDAVKHDVSVMLTNAQNYFCKSAEQSTKMKRLSEEFTFIFSDL